MPQDATRDEGVSFTFEPWKAKRGATDATQTERTDPAVAQVAEARDADHATVVESKSGSDERVRKQCPLCSSIILGGVLGHRHYRQHELDAMRENRIIPPFDWHHWATVTPLPPGSLVPVRSIDAPQAVGYKCWMAGCGVHSRKLAALHEHAQAVHGFRPAERTTFDTFESMMQYVLRIVEACDLVHVAGSPHAHSEYRCVLDGTLALAPVFTGVPLTLQLPVDRQPSQSRMARDSSSAYQENGQEHLLSTPHLWASQEEEANRVMAGDTLDGPLQP